MDNTLSLNSKDKIKALSHLISEINDSLFIDGIISSNIKDLKEVCFLIDDYINESIDYAKTTELKREKIDLLIHYGQTLLGYQKSFEIELKRLGSNRDLSEENEIKSAFDFELDSKKSLPFLINAADIEKRILLALKNNPNESLINKYEKIFKDDFAYQLFLKLHEHYNSQEKYRQANYSFLFLSMQKDKMVICSGAAFVNFLNSQFNIPIDKIDTRQSGTNKKSSHYNAIKDNLLLKS